MTAPLPLEPVIDWLFPDGHPSPVSDLADRLGVTRRTVHRWARYGLSVAQADRLACALDMHIDLFWHDHMEEAA